VHPAALAAGTVASGSQFGARCGSVAGPFAGREARRVALLDSSPLLLNLGSRQEVERLTRAERAPSGSRYADQRHYAVPAALADLRGPRGGAITLDRSLDWSGDATYDLDDAGDLQLMYQTVLNQAATAEDLSRWLDGDLLRRLWPDLWLPARLRALWQSRFPELTPSRRALAG
jgi:hypothetical protein